MIFFLYFSVGLLFFFEGIYMLNIDGTIQVNESGSAIPSYDNTDIQNFARAWTGFYRQWARSNMEFRENEWNKNRMDPMRVYGPWRDPFPKMDLSNGYIGDKVPLCADLPEKQFLKRGAKYRLLGSSIKPDFHDQPTYYDYSYSHINVRVLQLEDGSVLKSTLMNGGNFPIELTLTSDLVCTLTFI